MLRVRIRGHQRQSNQMKCKEETVGHGECVCRRQTDRLTKGNLSSPNYSQALWRALYVMPALLLPSKHARPQRPGATLLRPQSAWMTQNTLTVQPSCNTISYSQSPSRGLRQSWVYYFSVYYPTIRMLSHFRLHVHYIIAKLSSLASSYYFTTSLNVTQFFSEPH